MTGVPPAFAVAEAASLVLAIASLAERTPRLVAPFLVAAGVALAASPAAPVPRLAAAACLFVSAALLPEARRRMAHLAMPAPPGGAGATLRLLGALALTVLATTFAASGHMGEAAALALAVTLVGAFAVAWPAAEPVRLARALLPGAGVALLAASVPAASPGLLVLPVLLPIAAVLAAAAILARTGTLAGTGRP